MTQPQQTLSPEYYHYISFHSNRIIALFKPTSLPFHPKQSVLVCDLYSYLSPYLCHEFRTVKQYRGSFEVIRPHHSFHIANPMAHPRIASNTAHSSTAICIRNQSGGATSLTVTLLKIALRLSLPLRLQYSHTFDEIQAFSNDALIFPMEVDHDEDLIIW